MCWSEKHNVEGLQRQKYYVRDILYYGTFLKRLLQSSNIFANPFSKSIGVSSANPRQGVQLEANSGFVVPEMCTIGVGLIQKKPSLIKNI